MLLKRKTFFFLFLFFCRKYESKVYLIKKKKIYEKINIKIMVDKL